MKEHVIKFNSQHIQPHEAYVQFSLISDIISFLNSLTDTNANQSDEDDQITLPSKWRSADAAWRLMDYHRNSGLTNYLGCWVRNNEPNWQNTYCVNIIGLLQFYWLDNTRDHVSGWCTVPETFLQFKSFQNNSSLFFLGCTVMCK